MLFLRPFGTPSLSKSRAHAEPAYLWPGSHESNRSARYFVRCVQRMHVVFKPLDQHASFVARRGRQARLADLAADESMPAPVSDGHRLIPPLGGKLVLRHDINNALPASECTGCAQDLRNDAPGHSGFSANAMTACASRYDRLRHRAELVAQLVRGERAVHEALTIRSDRGPGCCSGTCGLA